MYELPPPTAGSLPLERVLDHWNPGSIQRTGTVDESTSRALAGLLKVDAPRHGEPLRAFWHEVILREPEDAHELGPDGHPASSPLLPPIRHRQRMFGGGQLKVELPLRVGDRVTRLTTVTGAEMRDARSGRMLVVTERHEWRRDNELCLAETRQLLYRELTGETNSRPAAPDPSPQAVPSLTFVPTRAMLATYSDLTGNRHRIHTDKAYAQHVEGHQDLLVHGPLSALLAAEAFWLRTGDPVSKIRYRLQSSAFADRAICCYVQPPAPDDPEGRWTVSNWSGGRRFLRASVA